MEKSRLCSLLLRTERISGWILILLVITYFITGFAMSGSYGLYNVINVREALYFHTALHPPLLLFFVLHVAPAIFFKIRGWRKKE